MLYSHQIEIIEQDPTKCGLWLGTGSGKTLIALSLARGKTLVIAPKTQKEDKNWEREVAKNKLKIDLTVISKETFRRDHLKLPSFNTVIIDEAHLCLGVTPNTRQRKRVTIPRASQLFEAVQRYLEIHNPSRFYLCTATIIRSPMTVWAAGKLLGRNWNFYDFRHAFYTRLPIPGREIYVPRKDRATKDRLAGLVKGLGFVGRLEDYFDVPAQVYKTVYLNLTAEQRARLKNINQEFPEQIVRVGKRHQIENGILSGDEFNEPETFKNEKLDAILDLAIEFPKMIIFAKYIAQIEAIHKALAMAGKKVLKLTGNTPDRGEVIAEAEASEECIFIAQAQISAGWELPSFPVVVFSSMSYSIVDRVQGEGRVLRANSLKKNLYITLVVRGGVDEAVFKCINEKKDFSERLYEEPGS